ncbi:DDB1- and CUL4-associated factor 5 [Aricia agestis]|uniref:DDB1- and CUL4-associated factor 5 n=1 Tax=Aricia agestis TaxID=91739 RepID=UPI001C2050F3|nr:DDB1- and CUL4-associated factor 5 [Aricia agestis]
MANTVSPLPFVTYREYGLKDPKSELFDKRLDAAKNLYRRDLICHFGCVNAIEFSNDGELLISGGDDKRVMVWQFGQAIFDYGKPEAMKTGHHSNIFCLGITSDNKKIYSGGNDDMVIVHDLETKSPVEVLEHQKAVCSLAIDPFNEQVVSTAGNDGRLLLFDTRQSVHESMVIARSRKAFHGVMFHPQQVGLLVSANARDGVALWDLRAPKHAVQQYMSSNGLTQNSMSVRFNAAGSHILALRRRQAPVLYRTHGPEPVAEFHHPDYYNSCTMKSCSFAGGSDQFVLSGSDDFNLYMWKVLDEDSDEPAVKSPHVVLYGHRSIVNQVRYNHKYCVIASSGVEKIVKIWSALEYPGMRGALLDGAAADHPRGMYTHEDYVEFVHHGNHSLSHNYLEQSTREDPRMMAFFDSLVQRELECLAGESDSDTLASEPRSDSDSDRRPPDYLSLTHKRVSQNVNRSQRCPNRLARLVASRYPKHVRAQKRGSSLRRNKQSRTCVAKACGRRAPPPTPRARPSAPSSERTDSDEPTALFRPPRMARPLRRRINVTRAAKRKNKLTSYRKVIMNLRSNGSTTHDSSDNSGFSHFNQFEENLAQPSTSTGYRGQNNSALFRIAEVDSDDDQSGGSRPISPRPAHTIPSRSPPHDHRLRNIRRIRRNGRTLHRSDSSESPPPKDVSDRISAAIERLTPKVGYNRTVARLMNETNESELESSCSTDSPWTAPPRPAHDDITTDDVTPDEHAHKFRQRVKKARRYRTHVESDSN